MECPICYEKRKLIKAPGCKHKACRSCWKKIPKRSDGVYCHICRDKVDDREKFPNKNVALFKILFKDQAGTKSAPFRGGFNQFNEVSYIQPTFWMVLRIPNNTFEVGEIVDVAVTVFTRDFDRITLATLPAPQVRSSNWWASNPININYTEPVVTTVELSPEVQSFVDTLDARRFFPRVEPTYGLSDRLIEEHEED